MTTAMNGLDRTTLKAYATSLALLLTYDHVLKSNVLIGHPPIDDCPAWTWVVGLTMQSIIYPYLYCRALYASRSVGLLGWFRSSWSERSSRDGTSSSSSSSAFWEKLWFASFAAYLTRDTVHVLDSPMYIAHHIVCLTGVAFSLWIPRGSIPLLSGMMMLELGSLGMTCAKILPGGMAGDEPGLDHTDLRWDGLYHVLMPISNVLCLLCAAYNLFVPFDLPKRWKWVEPVSKSFFAVLTAVLVYMRQDAADDNRAEAGGRYAAVVNPPSNEEKWIGDDAATVLAQVVGLAWVLASARAFWTSYRKEGYIMYRFETVGVGSKKKGKKEV